MSTPEIERRARSGSPAEGRRRRRDRTRSRNGGRSRGPAPAPKARAAARRAAAAGARLRRLGGAGRRALRGHRGDARKPTSRRSSGRCSSAPPGSSSSSSTASTTTTTGGSATAPSTRCPRWSRPASSAPSSSTACWRSARSARSPDQRDRGRGRGPGRQLRRSRRPALLLAPADAAGDRPRDRPGRTPSTRSPAASPPTRRRAWRWSATSPKPRPTRSAELPLLGPIADIAQVAADHEVERVVVAEQQMSERGGRAADRGVQGGRPGADLPAPALRPARAGDRAQPPRRAAGARLPLLRPAALDAWR